LNALRDRELVFDHHESAFAGSQEYTFKHAILHEVTYESVLKRVRRAYHRLVADWLIAESGDRAAELLGVIADHLEAAGDRERAADYLRRAGEQAAARYASAEAAGFFTRALALTPEADLAARFALVVAREEAHSTLGAREAQRVGLALLAALAEQLNDARRRAVAALRWATLELDTGNYTACAAHAETALALAEAVGDHILQATSLVRLGFALIHLGSLTDARIALEKSVVLARQAGAKAVEAFALNGLAWVAADQGDLDVSHACDRQSLDIRYELGDTRTIVVSLNDIGFQQNQEGDAVSATRTLEEALRLARQAGSRVQEGYILLNLGACAMMLGDHALAQKHQAAAWRIAEETQNRTVQFDLLIDSIGVLRQLGRPEEAYQEGLHLLQMIQEEHSLYRNAAGWTLQGRTLADLGRLTESREAYGRALAAWEERGDRLGELSARAGLANAALQQGGLGSAQAQVIQILPHIADSAVVSALAYEAFPIYLTCYRVLATTGDHRAAGLLEQAVRLVHERAARIPDPEQRRSFTENLIEVRAILAEHARLYGGVQTIDYPDPAGSPPSTAPEELLP
jgi:tetratricopeptide (TPR) repeat protein